MKLTSPQPTPSCRHRAYRPQWRLRPAGVFAQFFAVMGCLAFLLACPQDPIENARTPTVLGQRGSTPGHFSYPRGIDALPGGPLAVSDKTGRIQILGLDGALLSQWRMPKCDNGTPTGIIFDRTAPADTDTPDAPTTATLLVADTHNSRVMRFGLDGQLLLQFGEYGSEPGQMIYPTDIALDPAGNLYITEYGERDRVMKYSPDGNFISQWGDFGTEPGQFQRPMALTFTEPGRIIVADSCNHRLQVFTTDGELLAIWGELGSEPGQFNYPYDVAVDAHGRIAVAEFGNNRIQLLDAEGHALGVFGQAGSRPGQFGTPWGVTFTGEQLAIADTNNHRLQLFDRFPLKEDGTR